MSDTSISQRASRGNTPVPDQAPERMTRAEREDLARLIRRREKLAKYEITVLAARRKADFERQMATIHSYDDDAVWKAAHELAQSVAAEANQQVAERCQSLGIPREFAPGIAVGWYGRGQNASLQRRAQLRKVAYTRIDKTERDAKLQIEKASLAVQTLLLAGGLKSAEAKAFLESMPTSEMLMPAVSVAEAEAALPAGVSK